MLHSVLCFMDPTATPCQVLWRHHNHGNDIASVLKEMIMQIREGLLEKTTNDHFKECLTAK